MAIFCFCLAALWEFIAVMKFVRGDSTGSAVIYLCLGSAWLCFSAVLLNRIKKEKNDSNSDEEEKVMKPISCSYTRERMFSGFDGTTCKVDPKIIFDGKKNAFLTYTTLLLSGSDVFSNPSIVKSTDGGKTFGTPEPYGEPDTFSDGIRRHLSVANVYYNRFHQQGMVLGVEQSYKDDATPVLNAGIAIGRLFFYRMDMETGRRCSPVQSLSLPFETISAVPHGQILEDENGEMLLTFYYTTPENFKSSVITARAALQGDQLVFLQFGTPLEWRDSARGIVEPSLAKLGDLYFLTLRSDEQGLLAVGDSPYEFSEPKPWVWDDGEILGNYNTMQRWIRFRDGLYLAYTRRGAKNDHVFRHRAPLFMTRFDEDRCCLIRSEEIVLVPELGARLGNFSVLDVSDTESWLTTAEWMQPVGCEAYGSDNSIWRVCIRCNP